jgi:hypothetical protein
MEAVPDNMDSRFDFAVAVRHGGDGKTSEGPASTRKVARGRESTRPVRSPGNAATGPPASILEA